MDAASGTAAITIGISHLQNFVEWYEAHANSIMLIILLRPTQRIMIFCLKKLTFPFRKKENPFKKIKFRLASAVKATVKIILLLLYRHKLLPLVVRTTTMLAKKRDVNV